MNKGKIQSVSKVDAHLLSSLKSQNQRNNPRGVFLILSEQSNSDKLVFSDVNVD